MDSEIQALVDALTEIAGDKGKDTGLPMSKGPCPPPCNHADCKAARALFRWRRWRIVNEIGKR